MKTFFLRLTSPHLCCSMIFRRRQPTWEKGERSQKAFVCHSDRQRGGGGERRGKRRSLNCFWSAVVVVVRSFCARVTPRFLRSRVTYTRRKRRRRGLCRRCMIISSSVLSLSRCERNECCTLPLKTYKRVGLRMQLEGAAPQTICHGIFFARAGKEFRVVSSRAPTQDTRWEFFFL